MKKNQFETITAYDRSAGDFEKSIAQLNNYNITYDYLSNLLQDNYNILDLACGPANISKYLLKKNKLNITGFDLSEEMLKIAKINIPDGNFFKKSIIDFNINDKFEAVIIGFGLPYLNQDQLSSCIKNSYKALRGNGIIYISFMDGDKEGFEKPSFNKNIKIYLYYHKKEKIIDLLRKTGFSILKTWKIDYLEENGNITDDIIIISQKKVLYL